jgi:mono/diheme cytochrome c family protein
MKNTLKNFVGGRQYIAKCAALCVAPLLALASFAHADSYSSNSVPLLPKYQEECAACHIAYVPAMLPAASWSRLMGGLNKHYGADASLDEATVRELSVWLKTNSGTYKRVSEEPPQDRITQSAWFVRKHRKVDAPVWQLVSVKSAANCAACHTRAAQGRYNESELQYPQGLDVRSRRAWSD